MNISYLMKYVSRELHTIVRRYDSEGRLQETVCDRFDLTDVPGTDDMILPLFDGKYPLLAEGSQSVAYAVVHDGSYRYLIGPVILSGGALLHRFPPMSYEEEWLELLYECGIGQIIDVMLLMYNLSHDETLTRFDLVTYNCLETDKYHAIRRDFWESIFSSQETQSRHNPYDQERREIESIRTGNLEQLKRSWSEDTIGQVGVVSPNPLRNAKDLAIVLVTLGTRAAIEGGVLSEVAFTLSDTYINQIESVETVEAADKLGRDAEYHFTQLVHEGLERQTSDGHFPDIRVQSCKNYIFSHLHEKISLSDIAEDLKINPNYLASLFKKEEGVSVGQYILNEKINLAKNMLIYSPYHYSDIATYLGFSSQSHLGDKFRKVTGMTMSQYRNRYGVKDFI